MNASELKRHYEENNPNGHFFTRNNMKFAGDTMANYYVPTGTVMIDTWTQSEVECYELQRRKPVKNGLSESAFFSVDGFKLIHEKLISPF